MSETNTRWVEGIKTMADARAVVRGKRMFVPLGGPMEYEVKVTQVEALTLIDAAFRNNMDVSMMLYLPEGHGPVEATVYVDVPLRVGA